MNKYYIFKVQFDDCTKFKVVEMIKLEDEVDIDIWFKDQIIAEFNTFEEAYKFIKNKDKELG